MIVLFPEPTPRKKQATETRQMGAAKAVAQAAATLDLKSRPLNQSAPLPLGRIAMAASPDRRSAERQQIFDDEMGGGRSVCGIDWKNDISGGCGAARG